MLVYKLLKKQTKDCIDLYGMLVCSAKKECVLIIDDAYYIERYIMQDLMYYVHIKEHGQTIDKICIYEETNT